MGEEKKQSKNQILSLEKKKKLMKKLARIKLNNSRANNSLFDVSSYYDAKVRKLKLNNVSLAKALSEQKQVSQTWYDTVVSLREELHETQESLLRLHYQVKENGEYEHIIQESVERRIRAIAEPLEASVSDSLNNVYSLVENLTKVKQLVKSALSFNSKEKLNFSRRSSHSSRGSRPPLCQNSSKSPRKNVVHPMVEGHVLQPATIHISRMTLEERRRYRLQELAESTRMEVIGEQSGTENESTASENDDSSDNQNVEENQNYNTEETNEDGASPAVSINSPTPHENGIVPEEIPSVNSEEAATLDEGSNTLENEVSASLSNVASDSGSPSGSSCKNKTNLQDSDEVSKSPKKAEKTDKACEEDPLEGSSWMHLKKKRKTKSRSTNFRLSELHATPDTSSDSEEDSVDIPVATVKHGKVKGASRKRPSRSRSSKVSFSHLDMLNSKVSRRSKKSKGASISSNRNSKETTDNNEPFEEARSACSFIINDSHSDLPSLSENTNSKENSNTMHVKPITLENKINSSLSSPILGLNLEPVVNLTCIIDSPMEITQCLSKERLRNSTSLEGLSSDDAGRAMTKVDDNLESKFVRNENYSSDTEQVKKADQLQSDKNLIRVRITNKYFKTSSQESENNEVVSKKRGESCVYDISLMDASQITPCLVSLDKENVPPITNISSEDTDLKIKDISIVVKDIMKTPSQRSDADQNTPLHRFSNTSTQIDKTIKSTKETNNKNKSKIKETEHSSPLRKVFKKPKKMSFADNYDIQILSSPSATDDDDVWSPSKNANKRKTKDTKKSINSRKKVKQHSEVASGKSNCSKEICESELRTDVACNDIDIHNVMLQNTNPLCEIPMDSNTLGAESSVHINDVNDMIRKHFRKKMEHIQSIDNQEIIELASENETDPLAINEVDLCVVRPRRAALKIQSFKEPALNTKMRRKSVGKKVKKTPKKKSVRT